MMLNSWKGDGPCQDCGGPNIRWSAPFEIWDSVMDCGIDGSTGGIRCPQCFVRRAWDKGLTDVNWSLVPIPKGFGVSVPLKGRVVPTYHYYVGEPRELMRQWYASFVGTDGHWHEWPNGSTLFAESPPRGGIVTLAPILCLDFRALKTRAVVVISRFRFFTNRPVILGHVNSPYRLLARTIQRLRTRRSGVE